jgi:ribosome biogenesis GTPase
VTRELVPLPGGGALIDMPGLRQITTWDDEEGVDTTFAEISALAAGCRFDDCSHETEPGCAVRAALEDGTLDPARYEAYLALRRESAAQGLRVEARARAEREKPAKTIAMDSRAFFRQRGGQ